MLKPDIEMIEIDANMEEPHFADAVIRAALDIISI